MIPRLLYLLTPLNNPLVDNAGKRSPIVHLTASIAAFEKLMSVIADLPSLYAFDENKPVLVFTDASQLAIGAIITQEHLIQGQNCWSQWRWYLSDFQLLNNVTVL